MLVVLVFGGGYVLRPVLRVVAETKVSEAFTAAALLVVLGTALLVDAVGMSMALGAFIAGVLLADSEYRHELEADIEPFKGLLLGLFFMSVGMTANVGLLLEQPGRIALLVAGLVTVKFVLLYTLARLTRHSAESARGMAFALPQAGEFAFVLFSLAVAHRVMDPSLAEMLVIVVTISMIVSPLLLSLHTNVIEPRLAKAGQREFDRVESQDSRVIIAGFGRVGQIVGRVLRMRRHPVHRARVERRAGRLRAPLRQQGVLRRRVAAGDAARRRRDARGGLRARDRRHRRIGAHCRARATHFPHLKIIARARNRQHALRLMDLGVRYLIRETYLSSLDLAQHTLEALGLARAEALESIRRFDAHDRKQLQAAARHPRRRAETDPVGAAGSARAGAVVRSGYEN